MTKLSVLLGICLMFLGMHSSLFAQSISFCDWIRPDGGVVEPYNSREMDRQGQFIFIHYQEKSPIKGSKLYLFINYEKEGKWLEKDVKRIKTKPEKAYASELYQFREPGKYQVIVLNESLVKLDSAGLELIVPDYELGAQYYLDAQLTFCERVEAGKPVGVRDQFACRRTDKEETCAFRAYLAMDNAPLMTDQIVVDAWKWENGKYSHYLGETKFQANSTWTYTHFLYDVPGPGKYRIMVFTAGNIFIAQRDVELSEALPIQQSIK